MTSFEDQFFLKKQKPLAIWLTGLSGSGKSTIAIALEQKLIEERVQSYVLDGDNIRKGISNDLGFSHEDRIENIRRVSSVAALFVDAGISVIAALISPFQEDRESAKNRIGEDCFVEIYVNTSLKICEQRDPKGLYKEVRNGKIQNFTGISSPYEAPQSPDIEIRTEFESVNEAVEKIWKFIEPKLKVS